MDVVELTSAGQEVYSKAEEVLLNCPGCQDGEQRCKINHRGHGGDRKVRKTLPRSAQQEEELTNWFKETCVKQQLPERYSEIKVRATKMPSPYQE